MAKYKTLKRLKRRFLGREHHHIDTSVLIEVLFRQPEMYSCVKYLNEVGTGGKYRVSVSILVLGEVFKGCLSIDDYKDRRLVYDAFEELIDEKQICFYSPPKRAFELAVKIFDFDTRINPMDSLNYACAVCDKAKAFVCKDTDFSEQLIKEFGVKVVNLLGE